MKTATTLKLNRQLGATKVGRKISRSKLVKLVLAILLFIRQFPLSGEAIDLHVLLLGDW